MSQAFRVALLILSILVQSLPSFLCPIANAVADDFDIELNNARTLVQKHRYGESRAIYQSLIKKSSDDKEKASLKRELNFVLPYYEAEYYFQSGAREKAQTVIVEALRVNKPHPERVKKLKKLGVKILAARQDGGEKAPDEKTVAKQIGDIFKAYHRSHHSYPPDYEALNQLLPPEKGLLRWYDVIGYKGGKRFYSIQLRSRSEHMQVIDLSGGSLLP